MATNKNPSRRKRPTSRRKTDRTFQVLLASLFLLVFLVASLAVLTLVQRNRPQVAPPAVATAPSPPQVPAPEVPPCATVPEEKTDHAALQLLIERALWKGGVAFSNRNVVLEQGVLHYRLSGALPEGSWYNDLRRVLEQDFPSVSLEQSIPPGKRLTISLHKEPQVVLHFQPPADSQVMVPPREKVSGPKAKIAIVVDDLGRDLEALRTLLSLDLDLTMAVMPDEPHTRQAAELAHRAGREVLVHMPMEPDSYPRNDPGPGALLLGQDPVEIRQRVSAMFEKVPHAVGGNNHMGSRFTQYPEGMRAVFEVMKDHGLFFVDSRTSPGSVAFSEARQAGVAAATRDVFLDNYQDVEAIARQLRETVKIARSRRQAIAICHPYPETLAALKWEAAFLRQADLQVVPVSHLLQR
jgi:hypothetical protein